MCDGLFRCNFFVCAPSGDSIDANSGDDFINPSELGIAESEVKRLKNGRFILISASEQTFGHGTHAALWKEHLVELLRESAL